MSLKSKEPAIHVLEDSLFVVERANHVDVRQDKLVEFAGQQTETTLTVPDWEKRYHFIGDDEETVGYLLVLSAMNFGACQPDAWRFKYGDEVLDGYFAVSSALKVAIERGVPLADSKFLKQLSRQQLSDIFDGEGELPFFDRRVEMLNQMGDVLETHFGGKAVSLVNGTKKSAIRLLTLIAEHFDSFADVANYEQRRVSLFKRAQIFVGDVYGTFGGCGMGEFSDIGQITAFADDSLPFILRSLELIEYSPELAAKVDGRIPIEPGSNEEVEIRAASIVAVERLRSALADRGIFRNSVQLDWILWNLSYKIATGERHITISTAY